MDTNCVQQATVGAGELATTNDELLETEAGADAVSLVADLSVSQAAAFYALTSGGSVAGAARAANVTRRTVYAWLEKGHKFATAYEEWKHSIAETSRTRLLMIGEAATVQIARSIKQGDTRTALAVAKGMGLLAPPPVGPSMTQSVARKKAVEAQRAEEEAADRLSAMPFRELVDVEGIMDVHHRDTEGTE